MSRWLCYASSSVDNLFLEMRDVILCIYEGKYYNIHSLLFYNAVVIIIMNNNLQWSTAGHRNIFKEGFGLL